MAWVNNKDHSVDNFIGGRGDEESNYCNNCGQMTALKTLIELWDDFSDIPINNDDEIEETFLFFEPGTNRFDIWNWFEERCPNGLAVDLVGEEPGVEDAVQE